MENKSPDIVQLSMSFAKWLQDYNAYNSLVAVSAPRSAAPRGWRPPGVGYIKANFDAFMGGDYSRGLGVVFRDHEGVPLVAAVKKMISNMGVEETELSAACFALETAIRMGYENIVLEGDSLNVINAIVKKEAGLSPIYALYDYAHVLSSNFVSFSCCFVRRSGNTVAHNVARWDTGVALEKICMEPFSDGFKALIELDLI